MEFSFLKIFSTNKVSCIECVVWEYFVTEMLCAGLGYSSVGRTLASYVQTPSPSPLSTKRKEKDGFFLFSKYSQYILQKHRGCFSLYVSHLIIKNHNLFSGHNLGVTSR